MYTYGRVCVTMKGVYLWKGCYLYGIDVYLWKEYNSSDTCETVVYVPGSYIGVVGIGL